MESTEIKNNAHSFSGVRAAARRNLERLVDEAKQNSLATLQRVASEVPSDVVLPASSLRFAHDSELTLLMQSKGEALPVATLHQHALGQLAAKFDMPIGYARQLSGGEPWQRSLIEHSFRQHADNSAARILVRSVGSEHRGILSDKYRRLESQPLLQSFSDACDSQGLVIVSGQSSDIKTHVRAILPKVFEPIEGEAMVLGLNWQNSDFGSGHYGVSFFAQRLVCLNGMVGDVALKQIHLGGRLPDDLTFSNETYRRDTETMRSATTDIVAQLMSPSVIDSKLASLKASATAEVSISKAIASVRSHLTKAETASVRNVFDSDETILLPAGSTKYRFSNSLSWVANQTDDAGRKMALQQLAGKVLSLCPSQTGRRQRR